MVELLMEKRILFKKGEQRELLDQILDHLSVKDMALACRCSERTIRDWHREKFSIDFDSLRKLCDTTGVTFPEEGVEIKNRYWYTSIGAQLGGIAAMQKYGRVGGDPNHRKKKWREWWEREGKFRKDLITNNPLSIQLPKPSPALAEFVGIVLGDGGITKNQVTITLHRFDDKKYGTFVARLIASLFKVPVGIYQDMNALATSYVISRVILVNFCEKQLGLQRGNKIKHQVDIPEWIKTNKKFSVSCVRGLIDTDGSIFAHRYRVGRKDYSYKKLQFVSRSQPLRQSVFHILQNSGLTARLGRQYDIWIDNQKELTKYFKIIGTHNPKHLNNYLK